MKQILIALDYDPTARKVAESGFEMAKAMGAHVTLLHVLVSPEMYAGVYEDMGVWQINAIDQVEAFKNIETASQSFLEKAKKHLGAKSIDTLQKEGDIAQMIYKLLPKQKLNVLLWDHTVVNGSKTYCWEALLQKCCAKLIFQCLLFLPKSGIEMVENYIAKSNDNKKAGI